MPMSYRNQVLRAKRWERLQRLARARELRATFDSEVAEMHDCEERPCVESLLREDGANYSDRLTLGFRLMGMSGDDPGDEVREPIEDQFREQLPE